MKKLVIFLIFGILFFIFFGSFASAMSSYVSPTPENGSYFFNDQILINLSTDLTGDYFMFSDFNSSLVGYWNFDFYNSTGVYDNSTYSGFAKFTGTNFGQNNFSQGVFGNGLNFNGVDNWLNASNKEIYNLGNFTISVWIKTNFSSDDQTIVSKYTSSPTLEGFNILLDNGKLRIGMISNGTSNPSTWCDQSLADNQWHHVAITFNNSFYQSWADGVVCKTASWNTTAGIANRELAIGSLRGTWSMFNGSIDELMIFNRTLSSSEVLSLYNSTRNPFYYISANSTQNNYTFISYVTNGTNIDSTENRLFVGSGYAIINISFPISYTLIQRNSLNISTLNIQGNYSEILFPLEYNFDNRGWNNLTSASDGIFSENVVLNVSQGDLMIRSTNYPSLFNYSYGVGVGDVFIIAGQSNAFGKLWDVSPINSTIPYNISIVYRSENDTSLIPVPYVITEQDLWAHSFYEYVRNVNVPVFLVHSARGGSVISAWQPNSSIGSYYSWWSGYNLYNYTQKMMDYFTGDNFLRGIIWMQGEGDTVIRSYSDYYDYLNLTKGNFTNDFEFYNSSEHNFIVGQVNYNSGQDMSHIQRAQQDSWDNLSAGIGAITHDIYIGDDVHYGASIPYARYTYSRRWMYAILSELFGIYDKGGPIPANIYKINDSALDVVYDRYIYTDNYIGNDTNATSQGIVISNSSLVLNDSNVISTNFSNGRINRLTIVFDRDILANTSGLNFSMCSSHSCNNKVTVRGLNTVPTRIIFNESFTIETASAQYLVDRVAEGVCASGNNLTYCIANSECSNAGGYWYSGSCHATAQSTETQTNSGVPGTFRPSENALQNGWSVNIAKNQKVEISVGDEKKIVKVESVSKEKAVVSVDGNNYEIENSSSGKIDLDSDGFYDIEIVNNGVTGNYANLEFRLINEKIESENEEEQNENILDKIPDVIKRTGWKIYVLIGVIIVLIVIGSLLKKEKHKKGCRKHGY